MGLSSWNNRLPWCPHAPLRWRPAWVLVLVMCGLSGCMQARDKRRAGVVHKGSGSRQAAHDALSATAVPLEHALDLQPYLRDLIEAASAKRHERHIVAYEPLEAVTSIFSISPPSRQMETPDELEKHFRGGEELFETDLSLFPGFGDAMGAKQPNMHRIHRGAHGGPDSASCRSCHHRGGDDGAGEYTEAALTGGDGVRVSSAAERNPPALHGGGSLQVLAREVTAALQKQLASPGQVPGHWIHLAVQGTDFGEVRFLPDGGLDTSRLVAIDPDLVVRPFGWKGTHSTLRRFAEEAFQVHHGLNSTALLQMSYLFGPLPKDASAATRAVRDNLGDGPSQNPDRDQLNEDLRGPHLTTMAVYLSLLPNPVIEPPRGQVLLAAFRQGLRAFTRLGCAGCHKPSWEIEKPTWIEHSEDASSSLTIELDLRRDIRNGPPLRKLDADLSTYTIFPFSDLKRHDMGAALADHAGEPGAPPPQIPPSYFLTRPLWGLADSAPYLHDGRAATLHEAILAHGGEAQTAQTAYLQATVEEQRALQVFLYSLSRPLLPELTP